MAIPDGKPATDFSAMNREWVRAVAAEAAEGGGGGGGIPAPENPSDGDVLTYSSTDSAWVAAAPGGGGGSIFVINASPIPDDPNENLIMDKTWKEIADAMAAGSVCYILSVYSTETPVSIAGNLVASVDSDGEGSYTVGDGAGNVYGASSENSYPETEFE